MNNLNLTILRVCFGGAMFFSHGIAKAKLFVSQTLEFFDDKVHQESFSSDFLDPIGIGSFASLTLCTFAEFICAGLLILGAFTRIATTFLLFNMAVILYYLYSKDNQWTMNIELALLYTVGYLSIFINGSGAISLDSSLLKRLPFVKNLVF